MNFFRTSALLLVAAAFVAGHRDFSGSFDGASARLLRDPSYAGSSSGSGYGFGGEGLVQRFAQGFGGQSSSSKAASYEPSYAGSGNQDGGFRLRYYGGNSGNRNYDYDDSNASTSQKTRTVTRVSQYPVGSGSRNDDSNARSTGFRGYGNAGFSGSRTSSGSSNTGFSGSRALSARFGASDSRVNANYGFGPAPFSTVSSVSSVPAVLLAFPSLTSVSYGAYPYGAGTGSGLGFAGSYSGNDYSAGASVEGARAYSDDSSYSNGYSRGSGFSNYGASRSDDFSGYGASRSDDSASTASAENTVGLSGAGFRGNRFADEDNSATFDNARTYTKTSYTDSNSDSGNNQQSSVAFLPVVTVPTTSAQGAQAGSASRHTKIVRTTITTESDREAPTQGAVSGGTLRAAVLPVVSGSYGSTSASDDDSASYSALDSGDFANDASTSSSYGSTSGSFLGGRSGSFGRLAGYGVSGGSSGASASASSARAFSASSSQAGSSALSALN